MYRILTNIIAVPLSRSSHFISGLRRGSYVRHCFAHIRFSLDHCCDAHNVPVDHRSPQGRVESMSGVRWLGLAFGALLCAELASSLCNCSGHGTCSQDYRQACTCSAGFTGADCSLRSCPLGPAWTGVSFTTDGLHSQQVECSNMVRDTEGPRASVVVVECLPELVGRVGILLTRRHSPYLCVYVLVLVGLLQPCHGPVLLQWSLHRTGMRKT